MFFETHSLNLQVGNVWEYAVGPGESRSWEERGWDAALGVERGGGHVLNPSGFAERLLQRQRKWGSFPDASPPGPPGLGPFLHAVLLLAPGNCCLLLLPRGKRSLCLPACTERGSKGPASHSSPRMGPGTFLALRLVSMPCLSPWGLRQRVLLAPGCLCNCYGVASPPALVGVTRGHAFPLVLSGLI